MALLNLQTCNKPILIFITMKKIYLSALLGLLLFTARAAVTDTVSIYSAAMNKSSKCVVIMPGYKKDTTIKWPVVYLLHGYSGNYSNWISKVPALQKYADEMGMMIVCPDGDYSSWYFDSPVDNKMKYETYISKEVPAYIDAHYPTKKERTARAITGLSMGGHGGLFIGFRHADIFGACGSMSGGVDLKDLKTKFDVAKRVGDTVRNKNNWKELSVMNLIDKKPAAPLSIIIDCGTEDFFYSINHALHEKMLRLKIPHDYIERPGQHDWKYWSNAVEYQLLFFRDYFYGS